MAKEISDNWFGVLTIDNIEQVVKVIEQILTGKRYVFVSVNMYGAESVPGELISRPEVRTSERLTNGKDNKPIDFWHGDNREYAGFNVCDTYGVWGASTYTNDPAFDPRFENPYIVFEWGRVIRITHRAPAGHLLYWVIATEDDND